MRCEGCLCPNARTINRKVEECDVLIVGEYPIPAEINTGQPMPGDGGKLLAATMRAVTNGAAERLKFGFTHAVACWQDDKKVTPKAAVVCRPNMQMEIMARKPKVIIALGNTALHSLTGDDSLKITKCLGRIFVEPNTQVPVAPVIHPAAVRRRPQDFKDFEEGLRVALTLALDGIVEDRNPGVTEWRVLRTDEDAQRAVDYLIKLAPKKLSCDIETTGFYWRRGDKMMQVGISWEKNRVFIFKNGMWKYLIPFFKSRNIKWVWQNGKFDCKFLRQDEVPARVDDDTMLLHYVLDERLGTHGLKPMAAKYLGAGDYSAALDPYLDKEDGSYANIPPELLDEYHAKDCDYTLQLDNIFQQELEKDPALINAYRNVLIPGSELLLNVEEYGFWVDQEHLNSLSVTLTAKSVEMFETIQKLVKDVWDPTAYQQALGTTKPPLFFNPGSPQQLEWLLYEKLHLQVPKGFPRNTREETLLALNPKHPLIDHIIDYREVKKQKSTYVEGVRERLDPDGRIRSTFLLHGTPTGRLASRNPNMQNIPRNPEIKAIFAAPPGRVLVEADYSAAELRVLAYLSGDVELIRIFADDQLDLHSELAAFLYGPNFTEEDRVKAKMVNFGIAYGRGGDSIAQQFGIPKAEGQRMVNGWFERFPQAYEFLKSCEQAVREGRALVTPFGRKRRFGLTTQQTLIDQINQGKNFPMQSTASDLTLMSGVRLQPQLRVMDSSIINLVHDSLIVEAPDDERIYRSVAQLVSDEMCATPSLLLPEGDRVRFKVDVKIGRAWGKTRKV